MQRRSSSLASRLLAPVLALFLGFASMALAEKYRNPITDGVWIGQVCHDNSSGRTCEQCARAKCDAIYQPPVGGGPRPDNKRCYDCGVQLCYYGGYACIILVDDTTLPPLEGQ